MTTDHPYRPRFDWSFNLGHLLQIFALGATVVAAIVWQGQKNAEFAAKNEEQDRDIRRIETGILPVGQHAIRLENHESRVTATEVAIDRSRAERLEQYQILTNKLDALTRAITRVETILDEQHRNGGGR